MPQRPFIAANWKMNMTLREARDMMKPFREGLDASWPVDVAICPPFTLLFPMGREVAGTPVRLGAQDVYHERSGAFTGEISAAMLVDSGCKYVIVGHSERRHVIGETDDLLNKKLLAAAAAGLSVIFCVGETLDERESGKTSQVIIGQLERGLAGLADVSNLTIAYEPVWAIGTGRNATAQQAQEAHKLLRDRLVSMYNPSAAQAVRIQYGGSVKPGNAREILAQQDVDGALVGGASLVAADFLGIIKAAVSP